MNERLRGQLLTACAFAKVFIDAADAELRGADSERREDCARHLVVAIESIGEHLTIQELLAMQPANRKWFN